MNLRKARLRTCAAAVLAAGTAFALAGGAPVANAAAGAGPQPLTPQLIAQLSQGPKKPVIVLLRNQHADAPPTKAGNQRRAAATRADQQPLVDQVKQTGATHINQFSLVNGFAAAMTDAERAHLAGDPSVAAIVPDRTLRAARPNTPVGTATAGGAASIDPAVCSSDPAKPGLEPEALQTTHDAFTDPGVPQAQNLATGKGVKVAYLADDVDVNNPDFIRADGSHVFVDAKDFTGEGLGVPGDAREAFGDASSVAAQGRQIYDAATFVNPANALPTACNIQVRGMAPGASLVGLKVTTASGAITTSAAVQAIDYAVNVDHVDIINQSLNGNPFPDRNTDPLSLADDAAVAAGVTVVNSTADAGIGNNIGSPASDPNVIAVGASSTYRVMAQTWDSLPGLSGKFVSDNVSAISSSGIEQRGRVYDLIAPGDLGWALCSPNTKIYLGCTSFAGQPSPVQVFGGTSESSPLVAGAAALVIEAYAATHHGAKPSPALIKQILTSTATDTRDPSQIEGSGLLNALAAVQVAKSISDGNGAPAAVGDNLLFGSSQLNATSTPGSRQGFNLTVTNVGGTPQVVTGQGRALTRTLSDQRGTTILNTTLPPTMHTRGGAAAVNVTRQFTVPAGADHLEGSIGWSNPTGPAVTLVLLDPHGAFAGFSFPQTGAGPDFGHVDVHTPTPGTWTAIMYSPASTAGFNGPVNFEFKTEAYTRFGAVSGQLALAPGQTGTLHVAASTPATPGDQAAAVQVDTAAGRHYAVPLVLRSLVPNNNHGGFSGVLASGNGRTLFAAQTNTYDFDVPAGKRDVDVNVTLHGPANTNVIGYLVSPDGEIVGQSTNVTAVGANGAPTEFSNSLQVYRRNPVAGRWAFTIVFNNNVGGPDTQEPFSGQLRFNQVDVSAAGLPNSAHAVLPAGRPSTVTVTVHNTGAATGSFYVDARTPGLVDAQLVPTGAASNVPVNPFAVVGYVLPTNSTSVTGITSGSSPVSADLAPNTGEPENLAFPGPGNISVVSAQSPALSQGLWLLEADQVGPFPVGTSGVTANFAVVAHTQGFDPAVTSSTGDHWLTAVQAHPAAFTPVSVDPGASGTITVTITPSAAKGSVVSGWLYVDNATAANAGGDELTAIPYTYTVG